MNKYNKVIETSIDDMGFSTRARNVLKIHLNAHALGDIVIHSYTQISGLRGCGTKTTSEIVEVLRKYGFVWVRPDKSALKLYDHDLICKGHNKSIEHRIAPVGRSK